MAARAPKRSQAQARISSVGCWLNLWSSDWTSRGERGSMAVCNLPSRSRFFPDHPLAEITKTRAAFVAAQIHLIFVRRFAHKRDLRHVRAGAAVRASSHSHDEFLLLQSQ